MLRATLRFATRSQTTRALRKLPLASALLLATALAASTSLAVPSRPSGWVEISNKAPDDPRTGYRVFEKSVPGSEYKAYRIEAIVDAPPGRAAAAVRLRILDPRYVAAGRERRVVRRDGEAVILYFRIGAPMIDDRDAVTRVEPMAQPDGTTGMRWTSTDEGPGPAADVVRMPRSEGSWNFRDAGAGRSHAVYESYSELGGSIPSWIINRLMVSEQLKELEVLREVLVSHDEPTLRAALARVERTPTPAVGAGPAD